MIFEKLVCIDSKGEMISIIANTCHPATQVVSFHIEEGILSFSITSWNKSIEIILETMTSLNINSLSFISYHIVPRSSELGSHFQSQFYRQRGLRLLNTKITRFTMIELMGYISSFFAYKALLPTSIGSHSIGDMSFQMNPPTQQGQGPIVWQGNTQLRHRTGIDT